MLTENGMIDERYEVAAELMTLRADNERLERLANTWAEVIMKRDTEIERLQRELAEARELLREAIDAWTVIEIDRAASRAEAFLAAKENP
jgi:vacuolar-type H+-ATPase subunit I/STV1